MGLLFVHHLVGVFVRKWLVAAGGMEVVEKGLSYFI
jgi:hypothetical protein